ncbi:MAG: hypothetical protein E6528_00410, partial [Staphylococcus sp.]|nr:hypothetical protein [Staphylococcus sp.]MDU6524732.1 hypothetical protein [Enterococcus sp.]
GSFIMTAITSLGIAVGTVLPFTNFGQSLGLAALPTDYWLWLAATTVSYLALVTIVKRFYIHRYKELL